MATRAPGGQRRGAEVEAGFEVGVAGEGRFAEVDGGRFERFAGRQRAPGTRFGDVSDGTTHTLMVGERPPAADFWYGWWYAGVGMGQSGSPDSAASTTTFDRETRFAFFVGFCLHARMGFVTIPSSTQSGASHADFAYAFDTAGGGAHRPVAPPPPRLPAAAG